MHVRSVACACLLALVVVLVPSVASGHGAALDFEIRVDAVTPAIAGVTVRADQVASGALTLINDGPSTVEVLDEDGRPFLRIAPDRVEGDLARAAWYASVDSDGAFVSRTEAGPVGPTVPPRWEVVARANRWTWFDHRPHPRDLVVATQVLASLVPADVARWRVPLRVDDVDVEVSGRLVFVPIVGEYVARLDREVDGVEQLAVLPGIVPGLFLNAGDADVEVAGADGEPFLVFGDGKVMANIRSPSWFRHALSSSATDLPAIAADAAAAPVFEQVASSPAFGWLEGRLEAGTLASPENPLTRQKVRDWTIPMTIDGAETSAAGSTSWVPFGSEEPGEENPMIGWGLALATLGIAAFAARRQRRADPEA